MEQTAGDNVVVNSDGSRTAFYEVPTDSDILERLMRERVKRRLDERGIAIPTAPSLGQGTGPPA